MAEPIIFCAKMRHIKRAAWIACLLFVSACAPLPQVPVEERAVLTEREQIDEFGGQLIRFVQPGDTMHSIAFIAGLDVNKVALWNGISDTSKLQVGQRVRLTKPIGFVAPKPITKPEVVAEPTKPVAKPALDPPLTAQDMPTELPVKTPDVKTPSSRAPANKAPTNITSWFWPSPGKVIRSFDLGRGQQGVDIQATKGRAVVASNPGEVVYVGNSLKGYGKLIIIKHNDTFLSAYAHNDKVLVKEGQKIVARQTIGAIGINNRREAALHFQIRKNGRPVDPLAYLPKKN